MIKLIKSIYFIILGVVILVALLSSIVLMGNCNILIQGLTQDSNVEYIQNSTCEYTCPLKGEI